MIDVQYIVKRNTEKHKAIDTPYNPVTGEGCVGKRVRLVVTDAPSFVVPDELNTESCVFYLPEPMMRTKIVRLLKKHGSVAKLLEATHIELNIHTYMAFWTTFCDVRIEYDFEYFAAAWI